MRERAALPGDLSRLLRPRSVAAFGGRVAAEVIRQLRAIGYDGAIWPVHPHREEVEGERAYRSVMDLPAPPDAAFLGVNRHVTIQIVEALAARGAGGAVVHASGFSETGESGRTLQARLIAAAGSMPFFGPNCYGFINYLDGALLWPDQHGGRRVDRGVAIVTQSGNVGLNLTMQRRALPIGYLVTLGNQATVDVAAMIEALLCDERVTAIGLHIEGILDPSALARATARARDRAIPIVALKAGRSPAGAQLAITHTASLAGTDAVIDAFLRKIGIAQVRSIPALLECLKVLHLGGPLSGRDIASMSCSGGEAALMADAVAGHRLRFRALSADQRADVAATLPELVTISNPLDYHTFSWGNEPALTRTFAAVMRAGYAMTLLILDFPRLDRCSDRDWMASANAIIAAFRETGARVAVVATLPEAMPEERAMALIEAGVTPLLGIDEALAALEAAADAGELAIHAEPYRLIARVSQGSSRSLTEWEGKRLLAERGLAVPRGELVRTRGDAVEAARAIGFPVALKAVGTEIAHKTEIGGIKLGLHDPTAVADAAGALLGLGDAILVERMVTDVIAELILGINQDPVVGPYLVIGSGGIFAELVGDSRVLVLPATRQEIDEAIGWLRVARLLNGFRGGPRGDLDAVVDAAMIVQAFAIDHANRLLELDINPLLVRAKGCGVVAADVLIRVIEEENADD